MSKPKKPVGKPKAQKVQKTKRTYQQKTQDEYDQLQAKYKNPNDMRFGAPHYPWCPEIEDAICFDIATTPKRLKHILEDNPDYPSEHTFYKRLFNSPEFAQKYHIARERQQDVKLDSQHDELEWARNSTYHDKGGSARIDGGAVSLARLACDNIKWEASKLAPKKYGKTDVETDDDTRRLRDELLTITSNQALKND